MTRQQSKAKLVYGAVSKTAVRGEMEGEIGRLLAQGYQVAAMSQSEDEGGSWVTVLLAKTPGASS